MDPHRNYGESAPPEDTAGWYAERGIPEPQPEWQRRPDARWDDTGGDRYGDPRRADPGRSDPLTGDLPTGRGPIGPRSGEPLPPLAAAVPPPPVAPAPVAAPTPPRRGVLAPGSPGPVGDGVYRSRRPAAMALFGGLAALLEIPALLLLRDATFDTPRLGGGIVSAVCLVAALPLMAYGLYAVATGAVRAAGPNSAQAWLRPPVAYLSVALVLLVAAGLAA